MSVILKASFNSDVRRVTLQSLPSFAQLRAQLIEMFAGALPASFSIKYTDDDNDLITVSSDLELNEALATAARQNPRMLRLTLAATAAAAPARVPLAVLSPAVAPAPVPAPAPAPAATGATLLAPLLTLLANPEFGTFLRTINPQALLKTAQSTSGDLCAMFQNLGLSDIESKTQEQIEHAVRTLQPLMPMLLNLLKVWMSQMQANNPFPGVFGGASPTSSATTTTTGAPSAEPVVHRGVICDSCDAHNFTGLRFKCLMCPDYDLCEACHARPGVHPAEHTFETIGAPRGCQWSSGCRRQASRPRYLARFVADVNIPDGSSVVAGSSFLKTWRLRNESQQAWPEGCRLIFVGGDRMGKAESVEVPAVAPGAEHDVSVSLVAPAEAGRYVSYWRLSTSDGSRFGHRVWCDLLVTAPVVAAAPAPVAAPVPMVEVPAAPVSVPAPAPVIVAPAPAPAPAPVPAPSAPLATASSSLAAAQQSAWESLLTRLEEMGFTDRELNARVLAQSSGDVVAAVQVLLSM